MTDVHTGLSADASASGDVVGPLQTRVVDAFVRWFDAMPTWVVRAPGRVNLIGDHTDYNDGFVLPIAIDRATYIALRASDDRQVVARSLDVAKPAAFSLDDLRVRPPGAHDPLSGGWTEYVKGVAWALQDAGASLRGWEGVVAGDVPLGAGLSSSAALELAVARAFASVSSLPWDPVVMAKTAQRAENAWVGVQCGIMDQLISATGVAKHAVMIDCRSLETRPVSVPENIAIVVLDTATRRGLVDSEYNNRRTQCKTAAACFGVAALRDVDPATFAAKASMLHPLIRRRARHVITENARVLAMSAALEAGDVETAGQLMIESHSSLRDDFEVSSPELDSIVSLAAAHSACYGARMTGAGFGGCAVALVDVAAVPAFEAGISKAYQAVTGLVPSITQCVPSAGAMELTVSPFSPRPAA